MRLGIYYHIPAIKNSSGKIGLPAFFGKFVDNLATHVTHLYCFFHSSPVQNAEVEYWCTASNLILVSLGQDRPAYIKAFFPRIFFDKEVRAIISSCDAVVVRGPSPLAPYFQNFKKNTRIINLLVGSYGEGGKYLNLPLYKEWAVKWLVAYMHRQTIRSIRNDFLLVNSIQLEKEYGKYVREVKQIFTTTLSEEDFFQRGDTCLDDKIRLLYTGRLDWAKGLKELYESFAILQKLNGNFELHFVGWEDAPNKPVESLLKQKAHSDGLTAAVYFHGRKAAGPELLQYYRQCDIYILPSYHEGFPRTMWEALANSIPVICTPVGSIPHFLKEKQEVLFTSPKNTSDLVQQIQFLIQHPELRRRMIVNGFILASQMTLEIQNKKIIDYIREEVA